MKLNKKQLTISRKSTSRGAVFIYFFLVSSCVLSVSGCSTSQLRLETDPASADVVLIRPVGSPLQLGKTPMILKSNENPEAFLNNVQMEFFKEGYSPELLVIPSGNLGSNAKLSLKLRELKIAQSCQMQDNLLNDLAQGVAEAQGMILKKDFAESQRLIRNLIEKFPNLSTLHIMMGNTFYIHKEYKLALESYKKAQLIQPENRVIGRIIEKISAVQGHSKDIREGSP